MTGGCEWPAILVAGRSGVGKTALISRLTEVRFPSESVAKYTSFDFPIADAPRVLIEWRPGEVAMQETFKGRGLAGILLVIDATERGSEADVIELQQALLALGVHENAPRLLVGTRSDRGIPVLDLHRIVREQQFAAAFVTSAKSEVGIQDLASSIRARMPCVRYRCTSD